MQVTVAFREMVYPGAHEIFGEKERQILGISNPGQGLLE